VSAAAALLLSVNPALTPVEIRNLLVQSVTIPPGWDTEYGAGILNVRAALDLALAPST